MKKLISAILILVMTLALLASCGGNTPPDDSGSSDEGYIYKEGSQLYVVRRDPLLSFDQMNVLVNGIKAKSGGLVTLIGDDDAEMTHEIILGDTSRPESAIALALLREVNVPDNSVAFALYSDGNSLAVAYEDTVAALAAIDYILDKLATGSSLVLQKGYNHTEVVDLIAYYDKLDAEKQDAAWAKLEAVAGKEFTDAMKHLYSIYDENVVVWLANLYDPGVGGFYYSNSGRDTPGFLPDIESTQQALGFIKANGISTSEWYNCLPEWMLTQIGDFVYELQDEDGYFYHPQWGKNITINRRGRDYDRGLYILNSLGIKPKYKTANENISGTAAALTGRLGISAVAAVSDVIATAENTDHLKSPEAFLAYLEDLGIYNNSYSTGNKLAAQSSQIKAAGLADECAEYLAGIQNPENGLWDDESDYHAVNGLLKLSGRFLEGGMLFPNAEKAAAAAMAAITSDEVADGITDIYNTWYAFDNIIENLRHFKEHDRADALINTLRAGAVEGIYATAEKLVAFRKPDGSFSYTPQYSATTSQGANVAVPNSVEGDVNATVMGYNGIYAHILEALELGAYKVPLFGYSDFLVLISTLEGLEPVVKESKLPAPVFVDFEDETLGDTGTTAVSITSWKSSGKATIISDPRGGKCLEMQSNSDGGDYVEFKENISGLPATCYVFESDFCVMDAKAGAYFAQITLYNCYMFTFTADAKGENVIIEDRSSTSWKTCYTNDLGVTVPFGEWFNVRVEYYPGSHDSVRIKFYLNNKLIAITDNYYDNTGAKLTGEGTPGDKFTMTRIYGMSSEAFTLLIDNGSAYKTADVYTHEDITVEGGVDVDAAGAEKPEKEPNSENGAALITFEGSATGDLPISVIHKLVSTGSAVTVETVNRNGADTKVLALDTNPGGNDRVTVGVTAKKDGYNCIAFEADLCFSDFSVTNDTTVTQLMFGDAFMLNMICDKNGNISIENPSSPSWSTAKVYDICEVGSLGEWFKLRIEFYPGNADTVRFHIYLNDTLIAVSNNYRGNFKESPEAPKTTASDFSIYAISAADGVVMLDNVSLSQMVKSHGDLPVTTVTPL